MAGTKDLRALRAGEEAYVARIGDEGDIARRLEDIGLTPGTRVSCLFFAPSGEPRAYLVRGAVMALRREDAARVELRLERPCD